MMPKFCNITGISIEFLLTGKENPLLAAYHTAKEHTQKTIKDILGLAPAENECKDFKEIKKGATG